MHGAVLFDLDGTLVEYERSGREVLQLSFEAVGVEPFFDVEDYQERYAEFFDESESITHLRELIFADIAEDRGVDRSIGVSVAEAYAEERDHSHVSLLPGATEVLDALEGRRVGMVTNGDPEMQRPKLESTGLMDRFETVIYAGHDAPAKPDPAPFHLALDRMGLSPEESLYVGNDPEDDVEGAANAGLASIWLRNGATTAPARDPTYTIEGLRDLFEIDDLSPLFDGNES